MPKVVVVVYRLQLLWVSLVVVFMKTSSYIATSKRIDFLRPWSISRVVVLSRKKSTLPSAFVGSSSSSSSSLVKLPKRQYFPTTPLSPFSHLTTDHSQTSSSERSENDRSSAPSTSIDDESVYREERKDVFSAYMEDMNHTLTNHRVRGRKASDSDFEIALEVLLRLPTEDLTAPHLEINDKKIGVSKNAVKEFLRSQSTQYEEIHGAISVKNKMIVTRGLTMLANGCAKLNDPSPLFVAWYKIKEMGLCLRQNDLSTFLYVFSSNGIDREAEEVALVHDALHGSSEKTVTIRVKALIERGDAAAAETHLDTIPQNGEGDTLRLRTYLPILELYCEQGDIDSAFKLFKKMQNSSAVYFEPSNYVTFISAIAYHGYFRHNSPPILAAKQAGYEPAHGPQMLDLLLSEMANDVLEISERDAHQLRDAFVHAFGQNYSYGHNSNNVLASEDKLVASRVRIDAKSGICSVTGATLKLIQLDPNQAKQTRDLLIRMAGTQFEDYNTKNERMTTKDGTATIPGEDKEYAVRELITFRDWLDTRDGEPFTAFIDGPNVAFYGCGEFDYFKLKCLVDALKQMNENPLIIMPQKYFYQKFRVRQGWQQLSPEEMEILNSFKKRKLLYTVPPGCLDDYYWIMAGVSDQMNATNGGTSSSLHVPTNNTDGRWPGVRPLLISNDLMRDHKLELFEPRLFRRWCSSHLIRYNFFVSHQEEDEEERDDERTVHFRPADFFSKEIQGNPSRNNHGELCAGTAWHFPVSEWGSNERFCIRLPK